MLASVVIQYRSTTCWEAGWSIQFCTTFEAEKGGRIAKQDRGEHPKRTAVLFLISRWLQLETFCTVLWSNTSVQCRLSHRATVRQSSVVTPFTKKKKKNSSTKHCKTVSSSQRRKLSCFFFVRQSCSTGTNLSKSSFRRTSRVTWNDESQRIQKKQLAPCLYLVIG